MHEKGPLPGDPDAATRVERMIRVDHAGEFGARRIYEGQLAVLRPGPDREAVEHMAAQERAHLDWFETTLLERRVRPTLLHPLWNAAGFALGAATAMLGPKAAMACTVAVEEAIDAHYAAQTADPALDAEPALKDAIARFRGEEAEHHATGLERGAEQAPGFRLMKAAIKAGCRAAIWASERV